MEYFIPKRRRTSTRVYDTTFQKIALFIVTVVGTSELIQIILFGICNRKTPLTRSRLRGENAVKMGRREIGLEGNNCIDLVWDWFFITSHSVSENFFSSQNFSPEISRSN